MNEEFAKVAPSNFTLKLGGKERRIIFGCWALAQIEDKYGSLTENDLKKLEKDMTEKPLNTIPWLLSISIVDSEGLDLSKEALLKQIDNEGLDIFEVTSAVSGAMTSSFGHIAGDAKKKTTRKR